MKFKRCSNNKENLNIEDACNAYYDKLEKEYDDYTVGYILGDIMYGEPTNEEFLKFKKFVVNYLSADSTHIDDDKLQYRATLCFEG